MSPSRGLHVVITVLAALFIACDGSPTAPTPPNTAPATWSILPASMALREGDRAVFRISGPFGGWPGCRVVNGGEIGVFDVTAHLQNWTTPVTGMHPGQGTTGECVVTLTRVTRPGRVVLQVYTPGYWLGYYFDTVEVEATIDVVP